ncbi:hypothetical protein AGLY_011760 [Aphis glycines]|uniref:Uncharacterized protein n=1 Tax=Aphis glycines TaxID=307491 RepID=A0A6G0TD96_APHGL|nr:hypothetical protein AGLY_011760 [Aphis glycines]
MELEMDVREEPNIEKCIDCPFAEAEQYLQTLLPDGIKKIFIANGFSNKFVIFKIDDKDIENTEQFAIEILPDLIDENEYPEYYFFLCISDFYKEQLKNKLMVKVTAAPKTNNKLQIKKSSLRNIDSNEIEDVTDSTLIPKKQKLNILDVDLNRFQIKNLQTLDKYVHVTSQQTPETSRSIETPPELIKENLNCQSDFQNSKIIFETNNFCNFNSQMSRALSNTNENKWKNKKYGRNEREKRRRERSLVTEEFKQTFITNYIPILDEVSKLMENIENLHKMLTRNIEETQEDNVLCFRSAVLDSNSLLKCLYECAEKNQKPSRLLYETLHANMNRVLPSITTIFRYLDNTQSKVIEGNFRFNELRVYLIKKNLPLKVWISEDVTRITGKIEYDVKSNEVVGFVLPLKNGCPLPNAFIASNAKTIAQYFNSVCRANYAYVIMAKPLNDTAAPFCLSIYGTNNRFSNEDVINRWKFVKTVATESFDDAKEMAENGIGMIVNTDLVFENPLFFNKTNTEKDSVILKNKIIEEELSADLPCSNSINEIDYSDIAEDDVNNSISKILNCGNSLNLQDFIYQTMSQLLLKNLHFVGYWKNQEIESAVIGCVGLSVTMNVKKKNKSLENTSKNKIPPVFTLSKKRKVNFDEDSSEDTLNEKIKYADSPDTESSKSSQNENINNKISIQAEKYYAIIYDSGWYIGRILEILETSCKIKFSKAELDKFKWPKVDDLQLDPQEYIFYGPISLIGCNPFDIKRSDKWLVDKLLKLKPTSLHVSNTEQPLDDRFQRRQIDKHKLEEIDEKCSRNRKKRKRCIECYTKFLKELGYKEALNKAKKVTTFCSLCPSKPSVCIQCFQNHLQK